MSNTIYLMVLNHTQFPDFAPHPIADTHKMAAALICLSCDSPGAAVAMKGATMAAFRIWRSICMAAASATPTATCWNPCGSTPQPP